MESLFPSPQSSMALLRSKQRLVKGARISLDTWCEQWGRTREPSEVLGDGYERHRYSDQDQSYPLRALAHPFQPFFFGLDTFHALCSRRVSDLSLECARAQFEASGPIRDEYPIWDESRYRFAPKTFGTSNIR